MFDFDRIGDVTRDLVRRNSRQPAPDAWDRIADAFGDTRDFYRTRVVDVLEPVYEWVEVVAGGWFWFLETIEIVYPVFFYRFVVHGDERTCPECAAWHGTTWEEGYDLVSVPLHVNCRCSVIHAWTEYRTRYVDEWRLRWRTWTEWEWEITGWA